MGFEKIWCLLGLTLIVVVPALSIRCFQCSSFEHPKCADIEVNDTSSPFLHKCEPRDNHQMFCRKTVQSIIDAKNFTRITRTCGWYAYKSNTSSCQKTDTDFKLETNCQCFTDACNGATSVWLSLGVMFLGLVLCVA